MPPPEACRYFLSLLAHPAKLGPLLRDLHDAHHAVMDCLGRMLWESQRAGRPPDGQSYLDCVQRKATQN